MGLNAISPPPEKTVIAVCCRQQYNEIKGKKLPPSTYERREQAMNRVIVYRRRDQECWYIREAADMDGLICYKSREKAAEVARQHHPFSDIYIDDKWH
jgi:hypothetical protein